MVDGWTWVVEPVGEGTPQLIVRYHFPIGSSLGGKVFSYAWFEPAHFVMEAGMMMGLKQRMEAAGQAGASISSMVE